MADAHSLKGGPDEPLGRSQRVWALQLVPPAIVSASVGTRPDELVAARRSDVGLRSGGDILDAFDARGSKAVEDEDAVAG